MNPEALELDTAIGFSVSAGYADPAVQIGQDRHPVALLETFNRGLRGLRYLDYLDGKFVAYDPGIGEKGLVTFEGMQVRSADADPQDFYEDLALLRNGFFVLLEDQFSGFF
jgi:hypothetical protein